MDVLGYGEEFHELVTEMNEHLDAFDRKVFRTLRKMKSFADRRGDHLLSGYVYHNIAGAYYDHNEHDKVLYYIRKALYELLRSNDRALVARTYNLFALEAQRLGCFSIAYQYYKLAESFLENEEATLIKAIVLANTGDVLTEMGDPKLAVASIKKSLSLFKKKKKKSVGHSRLLVTLNLGLQSLLAGIMMDAHNALVQADAFARKQGLLDDPTAGRWFLLLRAGLACMDRKEAETSVYVQEIIDQIVTRQSFVDYMRYTCHYCQMLIDHKDWKKAGKLMRAIEGSRTEDLPAYSRLLLKRLSIAYYGATGEKKKMMEAYDERNRCESDYRMDEHRMFYASVELRRIVDELQSEYNETKEENEKLRDVAETDALSGIPNRYALGRVQEEVYNRALRDGTRFGVGIVDIDAFKQYNDVYGHLAGDACLRDVAGTLYEIGRERGIFVARYGGDEFVLIYEGMTDRTIRQIEKEIYEKAKVRVTHGFYNAIPDANIREWDFFMKADEILYRKKQGM